MADVSKGKDLVSSLNDTETRLKKVERQLAVPRKGSVSVTGTSTLIPGDGTVVLSDSVTVVTTATCLIHFFVLLELRFASATNDIGVVSIRDMETLTDLSIIARANTVPADDPLPTTYTQYGTHTALPINAAGYQQSSQPGPYGPVTITNNASWAKAAGKHTFNLVAFNLFNSFDIRKRKFFAWVQPF